MRLELGKVWLFSLVGLVLKYEIGNCRTDKLLYFVRRLLWLELHYTVKLDALIIVVGMQFAIVHIKLT